MRKVLFIFGHLSDGDVDWLTQAGTKITISGGQTLVKQGEDPENVYLILDGEMSVTTDTGVEIDRVGTGDIIGEMSFLDAGRASASVTAKDDAAVLCIPRDAILKKLKDDTGFAARFYHAMAIFLSYRLRSAVSKMGYGIHAEIDLDEIDNSDEVNERIIENIYQAGLRFERTLKTLANQ